MMGDLVDLEPEVISLRPKIPEIILSPLVRRIGLEVVLVRGPLTLLRRQVVPMGRELLHAFLQLRRHLSKRTVEPIL